jgi:hypothetical protein
VVIIVVLYLFVYSLLCNASLPRSEPPGKPVPPRTIVSGLWRNSFGETACLYGERVQNTHRLAHTALSTALLEMIAKGHRAIRVMLDLWFSGCLLQPPFGL